MKRLAASQHFQRQLKKLNTRDQQRAVETLKEFLKTLKRGQIPEGYGFKKINGDKYELRIDLKIRIAMKLDGDTVVCHVIGDYEAIRHYLRNYRNK